MKVALVYDRVNSWGGAERVLLALQKLFPKAPLYTSVYHQQKAAWADSFTVRTSFLQHVPGASSHHELLPLCMPVAFEHFSFDGYDLVVSVTSEAAKGIITKPQTKHICYCLTPTRYLWSGYDVYFNNKGLRSLTKQAVTSLRKWDKVAAHRPDIMVAISEEVRKRIKRYYGRESSVIYPPVELASSVKRLASSKNSCDYFLVVSRLSKFTKYKRIDLAVDACTTMRLPLKVIGSGSWKKELQARAGPTVEFLGNISDDELVTYYQNCKALIFPGSEDFGLTIIEAQRFGKPVIAFRGGGAIETVKEGKTGIFFEKQTKDSLIRALAQFESMKFYSHMSKKQAERFSGAKFEKEFGALVQNAF